MESYLKLEDVESYEYIDCDEVYDLTIEDNHNYFLDVGKPILVHNSGKSYDVAIFLCQYIQKYKNKRIVIGRDTLSSLKTSLYSSTLKPVWNAWGYPMVVFNKSATEIDLNTNNIKFIGVNDNLERAKGTESDLLWLNETFSIPEEIAKQYKARCSEFTIYDYNPAGTKHWLYNMEARSDYKLLKTVIFDNLYAPSNQINEILLSAHPDIDDYHIIKNKPLFKKMFQSQIEWESFKENNLSLNTANKFYWNVYGLGKRAASENLVFDEIYRYEEEVKDYDWKIYGGDFGYKKDPTALVEVIKKGKNLFLRELIYQTGLSNQKIAHMCKKNNWQKHVSCWDKSEEKSVDELVALGVNADAPPKAHIAWGIQKLHQFKLFIHSDSHNMYDEFTGYHYLKKSSGEFKRNSLNHLIANDYDNHTIDATRYALTYYYLDEAK